jgi:hypothetical protein
MNEKSAWWRLAIPCLGVAGFWTAVGWALIGHRAAIAVGVITGTIIAFSGPLLRTRRRETWLRRIGVIASVAIYTADATLAISYHDLRHWGVVILTVVLTGVVLFIGGVWERFLFWRRRPRTNLGWLLVTTAAAGLALTDGAALLSSYAVAHKVISFGSVDGSGEIPRSLFDAYSWQLCDAVPALHLPQTLHWAKPAAFPTQSSGAVLIVYRLLIVILVGNLVADIGRMHSDDRAQAANAAATAP